MAAARPLEFANRVSIWKKITGVWLVLLVLGFVLEREQGRDGVVDSWNDWVSRQVVNANRDVLVPSFYRWVDLSREDDVRLMASSEENPDEQIVYSGRVRDGDWMPGRAQSRVVAVEFSAQDSATFNQWPPGPVDYAVVLDQLGGLRCAAVGMTTPLQWWDAPGVYFHSLRSQIEQARYPLVLSLGMTDVARVHREGDPEVIGRALVDLPLDAVQGDGASLLIEVSGVLDEADVRLGALDGIHSAFTGLSVGEALPDLVHGRAKVPLVAKMGGRVVLGLPLALVMAADQVEPGEVSITLGDAVRWRDRRVPIDGKGCYDIAVSDALRQDSHWVSAVRFAGPGELEGEDGGMPEVKGKLVMIAREGATIPVTGHAETSASDLILAVTRAIDSGEHRAPVVVFSPLPSWIYWLIIGIVPVLTTVVLRLRLSKAAASLIFLLVLAVFFMVYSQLVTGMRVLVPTATPLGIWGAGLLASFLSTKWRVTTSASDARRKRKMAELEAE